MYLLCVGDLLQVVLFNSPILLQLRLESMAYCQNRRVPFHAKSLDVPNWPIFGRPVFKCHTDGFLMVRLQKRITLTFVHWGGAKMRKKHARLKAHVRSKPRTETVPPAVARCFVLQEALGREQWPRATFHSSSRARLLHAMAKVLRRATTRDE